MSIKISDLKMSIEDKEETVELCVRTQIARLHSKQSGSSSETQTELLHDSCGGLNDSDSHGLL